MLLRKMKNSCKLVGVFMGLSFSQLGTAHAQTANAKTESAKTEEFHLCVEPYVGYGLLGQLVGGNTSTSVDGGSFSGPTLGARALAEWNDLIFGGVDFSGYPGMSYAPPSGPGTFAVFNSGSLSGVKLGLMAGLRIPILTDLRFWVGYNLIDHHYGPIRFGTTGNGSFNGMSYKFGLSYPIYAGVHLNAEYFLTYYGSASTSTSIADFNSNEKLKSSMLLLSLSFPIQFTVGSSPENGSKP
jgi:hypothetical protein